MHNERPPARPSMYIGAKELDKQLKGANNNTTITAANIAQSITPQENETSNYIPTYKLAQFTDTTPSNIESAYMSYLKAGYDPYGVNTGKKK